jgi:hypothetical protein
MGSHCDGSFELIPVEDYYFSVLILPHHLVVSLYICILDASVMVASVHIWSFARPYGILGST